jgi:hypothetical protein
MENHVNELKRKELEKEKEKYKRVRSATSNISAS